MLCIAEKCSVAKQFATALSGGNYDTTKLQEYMYAYSFEMQMQNGRMPLIVVYGAGHNKNYEMENSGRHGHECFTARIDSVLEKSGSAMKNVIRRFAQQAEMLVLCQDNDREGEHIAWETVEMLSEFRTVNIYPALLPRVRRAQQGNIISSPQSRDDVVLARRCRFNSLTKHELEEALRNLQPINSRIVEAVDVRQQLDLRIGFALSQIQRVNTRKLVQFGTQNVDKPRSDAKYTFGTCQIPTLGLCSSKPTKKFKSEGQMILSTSKPVTGDEVLELQSLPQSYYTVVQASIGCLTQLKVSSLVHVACKESVSRQGAPAPPNTIELQKHMGGSMDVSAIMKTAEKLYQAGFISYPRTETRVPTADMNHRAITESLRHVGGDVGHWAQLLLQNDRFDEQVRQNVARFKANKSLQNDESHPPIHPLKAPEGLKGTEFSVYKEVCKLYLASLGTDMIVVNHNYSAVISQTAFYASKAYVKDPGWAKILHDREADKVPQADQDVLKEAGELRIQEIRQAPAPKMTQISLIQKMDHYGIGTDATIAEHIHHVKQREYVNDQLAVTQAGHVITQLYQKVNVHYVATSFRAMMEAGLREISLGTLDPSQFYNEILQHAQKLYDEVNSFLCAL